MAENGREEIRDWIEDPDEGNDGRQQSNEVSSSGEAIKVDLTNGKPGNRELHCRLNWRERKIQSLPRLQSRNYRRSSDTLPVLSRVLRLRELPVHVNQGVNSVSARLAEVPSKLNRREERLTETAPIINSSPVPTPGRYSLTCSIGGECRVS
jgi:hypothetical protein